MILSCNWANSEKLTRQFKQMVTLNKGFSEEMLNVFIKVFNSLFANGKF